MCADINAKAADKAVELIAQLIPNGPQAVAAVADVGKEKDLERVVQEAVTKFGRLDIMFNNAGISESSVIWWTMSPWPRLC